MKRARDLSERIWAAGIRLWAAAGAAIGLFILALLIGLSAAWRGSDPAPLPTPILTVLAIPSPTPSPEPSATPSPAPTQLPQPTADPGAGQGFGVGDLVEVAGTGGDGLRLRASPALDAAIIVLGVENEVFQVSDGPVNSDGFTWWFLVNLVDQAKSGWAVGNYLRALAAR